MNSSSPPGDSEKKVRYIPNQLLRETEKNKLAPAYLPDLMISAAYSIITSH